MKTIKFPGSVPLAALTVLLWVALATIHGAMITVTSTADDSSPGTLRDAVIHAADGDAIFLPSAQVFQMGTIYDDPDNFMGPTATPMITKRIIIEAQGSTLEHSPNGVNFRAFAVGPGGNLDIRNAYR